MPVISEMMSDRVSSVPVVDDSRQLVNVFTKFDLIVSYITSTIIIIAIIINNNSKESD